MTQQEIEKLIREAILKEKEKCIQDVMHVLNRNREAHQIAYEIRKRGI